MTCLLKYRTCTKGDTIAIYHSICLKYKFRRALGIGTEDWFSCETMISVVSQCYFFLLNLHSFWFDVMNFLITAMIYGFSFACIHLFLFIILNFHVKNIVTKLILMFLR